MKGLLDSERITTFYETLLMTQIAARLSQLDDIEMRRSYGTWILMEPRAKPSRLAFNDLDDLARKSSHYLLLLRSLKIFKPLLEAISIPSLA